MKDIIQIAGIRDLQEAEMLFASGVDWIGFPFYLPVHKEDLSLEEAAKIVRQTDSSRCVLITYLHDAKEILGVTHLLGVHKVQLHGDIDEQQLHKLRESDSELFIIKGLIVRAQNLDELSSAIEKFSSDVDAFITDTHDPVSGATGATGKTHDWNISRKVVEVSAKPVILAGGLTPQNVKHAINIVRPAGVDAHTGVEGPEGWKDPKKLSVFVNAARQGFACIQKV